MYFAIYRYAIKEAATEQMVEMSELGDLDTLPFWDHINDPSFTDRTLVMKVHEDSLQPIAIAFKSIS